MIEPLQAIVEEQTLLLDVRAPAEFHKGALPNSINLPILNDAERTEVGIAYKEQGASAATRIGHKLVSGLTRQQRVESWCAALSSAPSGAVMCWRGGQRSKIAQAWLAEQGVVVPRIQGGYKALRHACLQLLQSAVHEKSWWVLGGRTGVGKTVLLNQLPDSIDLEGRAQHRGSAFGGHLHDQPSQATFENALAWDVLNHHHAHLIIEDESRTIGRIAVPEAWHSTMRHAPLVLLEASVAERAEHIFTEYITEPLATGVSPLQLQEVYSSALQRISRRLGGARHATVATLLRDAFLHKASHQAWISYLLTEYYDPMYDYQLSKKKARIVFSGNFEQAQMFLRELPVTT